MKTKSRKTLAFTPLRAGQRFITLDVSSSATGWAVGYTWESGGLFIADFGVIRPPSGWDYERKMNRFTDELSGKIFDFDVKRMAMEWQSHMNTGRHVQGLPVLGQAQGAVWQYFRTRHDIVRVSERTWTKIGGRNAKKEVRQLVVKQRCPTYAQCCADDPKFDKGMDASDALGLAFWWFDQGVDAHE